MKSHRLLRYKTTTPDDRQHKSSDRVGIYQGGGADIAAALMPAASKNSKHAATAVTLNQEQPRSPEDGAFDCQTPHHTKLPAPGANIAHELHSCQQKRLEQAAGASLHQQATSDPILSSVSHWKATRRDAAVPRLKGGPKAYATLSFQRAPSAAPDTIATQAMMSATVNLSAGENRQPNTEQSMPHRAALTHKLQKPSQRHTASAACRQRDARQSSAGPAGHAPLPGLHAHSCAASHAASLDHGQAARSGSPSVRLQACDGHEGVLPSSAAAPSTLQPQASALQQNMQVATGQIGTAHNAVPDDSETQPDLQMIHASSNAHSPPPQKTTQEPTLSSPRGHVDTDHVVTGNVTHCSITHSPAQHNASPSSVPGSQIHSCMDDDSADCRIDLPGPILAVIANLRSVLMLCSHILLAKPWCC